jgi:hypothetical protein
MPITVQYTYTAFYLLQLQYLHTISVAEPEPMEQHLFPGAGAGAKVSWPVSGSCSGYVNAYKMLQKALKLFFFFTQERTPHILRFDF